MDGDNEFSGIVHSRDLITNETGRICGIGWQQNSVSQKWAVTLAPGLLSGANLVSGTVVAFKIPLWIKDFHIGIIMWSKIISYRPMLFVLSLVSMQGLNHSGF